MSQLTTSLEDSYPPSLHIKQRKEVKKSLPFDNRQDLTTLDRAGEINSTFHNIPTLHGAQ